MLTATSSIRVLATKQHIATSGTTRLVRAAKQLSAHRARLLPLLTNDPVVGIPALSTTKLPRSPSAKNELLMALLTDGFPTPAFVGAIGLPMVSADEPLATSRAVLFNWLVQSPSILFTNFASCHIPIIGDMTAIRVMAL